jgi:hypothetical protein
MIRAVVGLLGVLGAVVCSPALAASCAVPFYRTYYNQTARGNMFVVTGKRCAVIFKSPGPTFGARVLEQPAHGRVAIRGPQIVYFSNPGYLGEDRFMFARDGLDTLNRPQTRTVEMHVQVSDRL